MKTSSLKLKAFNVSFAMVAVIAISLGAVSASQQEDQIAIQLGGLKLKVNVNNSKTSDADIARALAQGRAMLEVKPSEQTAGSRAIILQATRKALSTPVTRTIVRQQVSLDNGKSTTVAATLDPQKTTASSILACSLKLVPNAAAENSAIAVAGAMKNVNGAPQFRAGGNTPEKIHEAQLKDASKAVGFAFAALQGSDASEISKAAQTISKNALNSVGATDRNSADVEVLVQSMVEVGLYTFQYAPALQSVAVSNFAQDSAPGKGGFVNAWLNEDANAVLDGIVKGALEYAHANQKSKPQANSQNPVQANVAEAADSGTVATVALRVNSGGGLGSLSLVQMVARAVSQGVVSAYFSACRAAGSPPMTPAKLVEACRESIIAAYTALGVTVPQDTFITQVIQEMEKQNEKFRQLVDAKNANGQAIDGAGNPNPSGNGLNVGNARPVTDTHGA